MSADHQELIAAGESPNAFDANSYSPMHAAASYAHLPLLEYLASVGGDVNLADEDGDTPLYVVESLPAAQWLVEHGANAFHKNNEGKSAAETLHEDSPEVAEYLRGITGEAAPAPAEGEGMEGVEEGGEAPEGVSNQAVDAYASQQTNDLLARTKEIMEQAERDGTNPDDRIREVVEQAVRDGFQFGAANNETSGSGAQPEESTTDGGKRARAE